MKIRRGECARDRNENGGRWGTVNYEVRPFERSKWKGEGITMGGSVGEEMKYEMVTHSCSGKALIYSLCLFWVIYCGCMRVSISTWPLGAETNTVNCNCQTKIKVQKKYNY